MTLYSQLNEVLQWLALGLLWMSQRGVAKRVDQNDEDTEWNVVQLDKRIRKIEERVQP